MSRQKTPVQFTIVTMLFLTIFLGNVFFWHQQIIGILLFFFFFLFFGQLVGNGVSANEHAITRFGLGAWILISGLMIGGSIIYYISSFTAGVAHVLVLLAAPIALWVSVHSKSRPLFTWLHERLQIGSHRIQGSTWLAASLVLLGCATTLILLNASATTEAIRSIWQVAPIGIFVGMALVFLILTSLLLQGRSQVLALVLTMSTLLVILSAAVLILPLGFGFDPFIHQATEGHIAQFGSIEPKPFYYIGQYTFVLFLHHAFTLPLQLIDTWLLPVLASILLPIAWFQAASHLLPKQRLVPLTLVGLFLIPLSSFVVTTPQGLANLWTLLGVLFAVPFLKQQEHPRVFALVIGAIAGLLTHPIAGIPFMLFVFLMASDPSRLSGWMKPVGRVLFWLIVLGGSVILPASFLINAYLSGTPLTLDLASLTTKALGDVLNLGIFLENRFEPVLDIVYLYGFNAILILLLLAIIGWWTFRKQLNRALYIPLILALMLVINFVILSTSIEFSFLIDYERQNYAERLIPLALFLLVPFLILGLGHLARRLQESPLSVRIFSLFLLATMLTSAFYLTYPRHDSFAISRGFNVSDADVRTVQFIESQSRQEPYVVLANQSVSAAAIKQFGFTRYYGDQFFYPVPTGNTFYQFFLEMNEQPTRERAREALEHVRSLAGNQQAPKIVFFVVNDYWWQAPRIIENAKTSADAWHTIADEKIHIFSYRP